MFHTIAAVSTGNVISAIGIIRMTGDDCAAIGGKVFKCASGKPLEEAPNRKLILGQLHDFKGRAIDSCCAIYTRGPTAIPVKIRWNSTVMVPRLYWQQVWKPCTSQVPSPPSGVNSPSGHF